MGSDLVENRRLVFIIFNIFIIFSFLFFWWGTETSTCKFKGFTKEQLLEIKKIVQKNQEPDDRLEGVYNVQVVFSHFFSIDFRPKL